MNLPKKNIHFLYHQVRFSFPERTRLKKFIQLLFKKEKTRIQQVDFIFCNDKYLLDLNRKFLRHNYHTDILTFTYQESPSVAEIYISINRIQENRQIYSTSFKFELLRVMIHGALHLCGYDDQTASEKNKMKKKEDHYLDVYQSFT